MMKLSVLMITYNQVQYIRQAVESALMQRTNFEYEIVIGDDCSTDGTRDVLEELAAAHPDTIRCRLHRTHVGMHDNADDAYHACKGEYIAYLEGDDYWTSPDKLQRQVDFLDNHAECALCFHKADVIADWPGADDTPMGLFSPVRYQVGPDEIKESYGVEDILQEDLIPPCSMVMRRGLLDDAPKWLYELDVIDWPVKVLYAQHGRLGYIDDTLAAYRLHFPSVRTSADSERRLRNVVTAYEHLNRHFDYKYDFGIRVLISRAKWIEEWTKELVKVRTLSCENVELHERLERLGKLADERIALHRRIEELGALAQERSTLYGRIEELTVLLEQSQAALPRVQPAAVQCRSPLPVSEGLQLSEPVHDACDPYQDVIRHTRTLIAANVPANATVVVVSKGDDALLDLDGRPAWHFPQTTDGAFAWGNPADSNDATAQLEALRTKGAEFLVFPGPALWWLDYYRDFERHLESRHHRIWADQNCVIYQLQATGASSQPPSLQGAVR